MNNDKYIKGIFIGIKWDKIKMGNMEKKGRQLYKWDKTCASTPQKRSSLEWGWANMMA